MTGSLHGRRFLFLQGISTPLFFRLGKRLAAEGAEVKRINVCSGDHLFWPAKATSFRGSLTSWPAFLDDFLADNGITDIILFGDCRPYHRIAIERAKLTGVAVHAFEEGVLRPHWISMDSNAIQHPKPGVTREHLESYAVGKGSTPVYRHVAGGFTQRAYWDIAFHVLNTVAPFVHPQYVRHRPYHPIVEGLGWVRRALRKQFSSKTTKATIDRLIAQKTSYFLLPLQLDSDAQIRFRSPFANMAEVMDVVMTSFARSAPKHATLLIKAHPLDNGVVNRRAQIAKLAEKHGLTGRVDYIDGGHLPTIIDHSVGVVLVNSTLGLTALHQKRPVYALAQPAYKIPGLTNDGDLDSYWLNPKPPESRLVTAFERLLLRTTQINGSFFNREGIELAIDGIVARMKVPADSERRQ